VCVFEEKHMNFYACALSQIAHFQMGENGKFMVKALVFSFACSLAENIASELGRERKILPFFRRIIKFMALYQNTDIK
jgi:uncharacterized membrane protein